MLVRSASATWLVFALSTFAGPALAGTPMLHAADGASTVHVTLGDPSSAPPLAAMKLVASPNSVASGQVTFVVANTSKMMEHELLVVSAPGNRQALPYDESSAKVVEGSINKVADSGDLQASTATAFTVDLKPGRYLLMCNEPGHYRAGMWEWLAVADRTLHSVNVSR